MNSGVFTPDRILQILDDGFKLRNVQFSKESYHSSLLTSAEENYINIVLASDDAFKYASSKNTFFALLSCVPEDKKSKYLNYLSQVGARKVYVFTYWVRYLQSDDLVEIFSEIKEFLLPETIIDFCDFCVSILFEEVKCDAVLADGIFNLLKLFESDISSVSLPSNKSEEKEDNKQEYFPLFEELPVNNKENVLLTILNSTMIFLKDPVTFMRYLAPLESALEKHLSKLGVSLNGLPKTPRDMDETYLPTMYFDGMPYHPAPKNKNTPLFFMSHSNKEVKRALDWVLFKLLQENGVVNEFQLWSGFVDGRSANEQIQKGAYFIENYYLPHMLFHGLHSHMLQFFALHNAFMEGYLGPTTYKTHANKQVKLSFRSVVEFLVKNEFRDLSTGRVVSYWNEVLDSYYADFFLANPYHLNFVLVTQGMYYALPLVSAYLREEMQYYLTKIINFFIKDNKTWLPASVQSHLGIMNLFRYCKLYDFSRMGQFNLIADLLIGKKRRKGSITFSDCHPSIMKISMFTSSNLVQSPDVKSSEFKGTKRKNDNR